MIINSADDFTPVMHQLLSSNDMYIDIEAECEKLNIKYNTLNSRLNRSPLPIGAVKNGNIIRFYNLTHPEARKHMLTYKTQVREAIGHKGKGKKGGKPHNQPCWNCKKYCGGCSWSRSFTPVKGWTADEVVRRVDNCMSSVGYKIYKCPEFISD